MRVRSAWLVSALLLSVPVACASTTSNDMPRARDASADGPGDAGAEAADGGGFCCPPDPAPGCCMKYGGFTPDGTCMASCDGMPVPETPGWKQMTDDHGCAVWTEPQAGTKCGAANARDSGLDADAGG